MHLIYPWQRQEWQYLLNCKHNRQVPHAILVKGKLGLGKYHLAQCFAEALLCQNFKVQACGECNSCQLLQENCHPDLMIVQPEETNKQIKIEQIRDVIAWSYNTSQQGGYKIVIINQAEMLNIASANSLLKTLEEPPTNIVIILVTHNSSALPATIISRCQTIIIKTPLFNEAKTWLQHKTNLTDLKLVLDLTENAPLAALSFIQDEKVQKRLDFFNLLYDLLNKKINTVTMATQYLKDWDIKYLLSTFMIIVNDITKLKNNANDGIINSDQIEKLTWLSLKTNLKAIFSFYEQLLKLQQYTNYNLNINQQLVLEDLLINWTQLFTIN